MSATGGGLATSSGRGPGERERVDRREDRRQRLEKAALELFAARGYHATAVEDVVQQARTSKSAFYQLFSSKEDCLGQLLARHGGALVQSVTVATAEGAGPRDRVRLGIATFVTACAGHAPLARLLLVESVGVSETIERVRHALHGRFASIVEAEVRRAATDDFYRGVDPVMFGRAVVGAVSEATAHFLEEPGADPAVLADGLGRIFAPPVQS